MPVGPDQAEAVTFLAANAAMPTRARINNSFFMAANCTRRSSIARSGATPIRGVRSGPTLAGGRRYGPRGLDSDVKGMVVMAGDGIHETLGAWLAARLKGARSVTVGEFSQPKSGFSAETSIFEASVDGDEGTVTRKLVLRKEVPDPAVYPQQVPGLDIEIDIQYRTMSGLAAQGAVPLAPLIGYEPDPTVLGAPFFVMGFVGGDVPTENPPYTGSGFFVDATPQQRTAMIDNGLGQLAAIHRIDWRAAGLDWLVPPGATAGTPQQISLWQRYADAELAGRDHPLLAEAWAWLHANRPTDRRVGLCWGDPRPGNIIWNDFEPVCLTDFEAVSIAAPEQDLAWWLMFDRTMHPDGRRLPGDPSRDQQRQMYAKHAGIDVPDTTFHEVFAGARYCAIVVRVMNRLVGRGDLPADNTIWLHNPASTALAELLDER